MIHLLLMVIYAGLVAIVFGIVSKDDKKEQLRYSGRVFLEFMAVGLILAWVIYFIPF